MKIISLLSLVGLLVCASGEPTANPAEAVSTTTPKFPNSVVQTADSQSVKFYDDLVKDKIVAMNFVFSTCPTICPLMEANFSQLQKHLKEQGMEKVQLISVSVDPQTDTPARLKKWSQQFDAQKGWTFVTGEKKTIDHILKTLEVYTASIDDLSLIHI